MRDIVLVDAKKKQRAIHTHTHCLPKPDDLFLGLGVYRLPNVICLCDCEKGFCLCFPFRKHCKRQYGSHLLLFILLVATVFRFRIRNGLVVSFICCFFFSLLLSFSFFFFILSLLVSMHSAIKFHYGPAFLTTILFISFFFHLLSFVFLSLLLRRANYRLFYLPSQWPQWLESPSMQRKCKYKCIIQYVYWQ